MAKQIVNTSRAPAAIGPYSQGVVAGPFLHVSGQLGLDPDTMQLAEGGIKAEARQVFDNITAIAQAAELSLAHCTRLTIYMVDLDGFDVVNQVMSEYFEEPFPARACVGVAALPKGALIEVESLFCRA